MCCELPGNGIVGHRQLPFLVPSTIERCSSISAQARRLTRPRWRWRPLLPRRATRTSYHCRSSRTRSSRPIARPHDCCILFRRREAHERQQAAHASRSPWSSVRDHRPSQPPRWLVHLLQPLPERPSRDPSSHLARGSACVVNAEPNEGSRRAARPIHLFALSMAAAWWLIGATILVAMVTTISMPYLLQPPPQRPKLSLGSGFGWLAGWLAGWLDGQCTCPSSRT